MGQMISLPHLLTTARRFVDGVCAIPSMGPKLDNVHAVLTQAFLQVDSLEAASLNEQLSKTSLEATAWHEECMALRLEIDSLKGQLSAERKAHTETSQRFRSALSCLGLQYPSINCWLAGDETECDTITARDHDIIDQINARQAAERELETEREAHNRTVIELRGTQIEVDRLRDERAQQQTELSAARADLEALRKTSSDTVTRLREEIRCGWGHMPETHESINRLESMLAAWKAREGGRG